jgi:hypothetical protein
MEEELNYLSERDDEISCEIMEFEECINNGASGRIKDGYETTIHDLAIELRLIESITNYITINELNK